MITHEEVLESLENDIGEDTTNEEARIWLYNEIMSSVRLRLEGDETVEIDRLVDIARSALQDPHRQDLINDFWVEVR